jgi:hypothetical protein
MAKTPKFPMIGEDLEGLPVHQTFDSENNEFVDPSGKKIVTLEGGLIPVVQIPVGTTSETVAPGDHGHTLVDAAVTAHRLRTSDQVNEATAQVGEIWLVLPE